MNCHPEAELSGTEGPAVLARKSRSFAVAQDDNRTGVCVTEELKAVQEVEQP